MTDEAQPWASTPQAGLAKIRRQNPWLRALVIAAVMGADLAVFALVFVTYRYHYTPAEILLYRNSKPIHTGIDTFYCIAVFLIGLRYFAGDYTRRLPFWEETRLLTGSLVMVCLGDIAILALLAHPAPAHMLALSWLPILILLPLGRLACRHGLARLRLWQRGTVVVAGDAATAASLVSTLGRNLTLGYTVKGVVVNDPPAQPPALFAGLAVLGPERPLDQILAELGAGHVVLAFSEDDMSGVTRRIDRLINVGATVDLVPPLGGLPLYGLHVSHFFGSEVLILRVRDNLARLPHRIVKRVFDVVVSALLALVLVPFALVIAYRIRREDGGPVLFAQERVGRRGKPFRCLKFRTMRTDAEDILRKWRESDDPTWHQYVANNFKIDNDPRVTGIGRFLRVTSLDELPQLLNVLRGEMSLVGPRPLLAREIPDYGDHISHYMRVRPGITGLWQVSGRSGTTFSDRAYYDQWYIKNWAIWHDIVILLKTVHVVLWRKGAA